MGKRTLAVILGHRVRWLWWGCIALAYGLPVLLAPRLIPGAVAVATMLTLPFGLYAAARATRSESPVPGSATIVAIMLAQIGAYVLSAA